MSMTEVLGPGAKCSTGQRRSKLQDKAKREKRKYYNKGYSTREEKERDTRARVPR
jgi:hypothetical protein